MFPSFHFSIERWRKNTEYGVWVSNCGRVRLINNRQYLEPRVNRDGYLSVFTQQGVVAIHRLVAYTWLGGKRTAQYTVDHINSNKRDNRAKNLRWVEEDINTAYAKFVQCATEVEEAKPQSVVEEDETLWTTMFNINLDEKTRGRAALKLYERNLITIRADSFKIESRSELEHHNQKMANIELDKFVGRIVKVANQHKLYCNHFWFIERVKND